MKSLAVKYRPKTFDDVKGQNGVKIILQRQIITNTIKHGYLFCGGAGTGKTTCARIFANEINGGLGTPIELDAASNNSVEDIRNLCNQAQTKALDAEYKVFILDECHSLSNQAWQAMLKTLEEPPAKSIFIFCTTNPEKIPQTILSRVQRYNFSKLDDDLIYKRLAEICELENIKVEDDRPLHYIAKLANGGMRDAITMLDICSSYFDCISMQSVEQALNNVSYDTLFKGLDAIWRYDTKNGQNFFDFFDEVEKAGTDLKWFIRQFFEFTVDVSSYLMHKNFDLVHIPDTYYDELQDYVGQENFVIKVMRTLKGLTYDLKYEQNPKPVILATFILF